MRTFQPSWYTHEDVPTWNYQAVHVYGTVRIMKEQELQEDFYEEQDVNAEEMAGRCHEKQKRAAKKSRQPGDSSAATLIFVFVRE